MLGLIWALAAGAGTWPEEDQQVPLASWTTLPSGVEIADRVVGEGPAAGPGAKLSVHYTGWRDDGEVFDSSRDRGLFAVELGQGKVIQGWEVGLVGMQAGGLRRLIIPPAMAYGERGGSSHLAGATLYFEVELVALDPTRAPPAGPSPSDDARLRTRGGIAWADLTVGDGDRAKPGERVCIDFALWRDGALVDHSYGRAGCRTLRFAHDKAAAGLQEGLRGMRVGGHRQVRVAPDQVLEIRLVAIP